MDLGDSEPAEILVDGIDHPDQVTRDASLVEPAQDVIDLIETRLESCGITSPPPGRLTLGDREGVGFLRYPSGGFYRPHRDRGDDCHLAGGCAPRQRRWWCS